MDNEPWKARIVADLSTGRRSNEHGPNVYLLVVRSVFRWIITIALGAAVALTGVYIAYCCDFLADLRFGYCRNLFFADRKRCCGGVENLDDTLQHCIQPQINNVDDYLEVNWVPWEELFGYERLTSIPGYVVAFGIYFVSCVALTGLACYLVQSYAPQAKGSGIPEVKAAVGGFDLPRAFHPMCLLIKSICLSIAVGAGLSLGKEGPLIHIGVCWAHLLSGLSLRRLPVWGGSRLGSMWTTLCQEIQWIPRNELAAVGAATGVATAFGAPLGGVLFAVEELGSVRSLSKRCLILCFLGSFSSSFILKYINLSGGNSILFFSSGGDKNSEWVAGDLWIYCFLGLLGGLWGAAFVHLNTKVNIIRKKAQEEGRVWLLPKAIQQACLNVFPRCILHMITDDAGELNAAPAIVEGLAIAAITALINFPLFHLLKVLTVEAINALFKNCPDERGSRFDLCPSRVNGSWHFLGGWMIVCRLILAASLRFVLTVITFGMSVPSGLFIPSLFIGACLGRAVGTIVMLTTSTPCDPGAFALVGAASMLGGFSRLTVSLAVIMFELTGEITMVVPVMCACLTSKVVGDYFNESIYDEHATLSGFAIINDLPDHVRFDIVCSDVMEVIEEPFTLDITNPRISINHLCSLLGVHSDANTCESSHIVGFSREEEESNTPSNEGTMLLPISSCRRDIPSVLLLKRGKSGLLRRQNIFGAVETSVLREWLQICLQRNFDGEVSFARAIEGPLLGINTPRSVGSLHSLRELDRGRSSHDLSTLVDTHIAKVEANAPLSVCYFIFHQNPQLKYIICLRSPRSSSPVVGVITRQIFLDVVCNGYAYPPLHPRAHEEFRSVNSARNSPIKLVRRRSSPLARMESRLLNRPSLEEGFLDNVE